MDLEQHFQEQADRCKRLASNTTDRRLAESLLELEKEFAAKAQRAANEQAPVRLRASNIPLDVVPVDGEVVLNSGGGGARALTPAAARETGLRLIESATTAEYVRPR